MISTPILIIVVVLDLFALILSVGAVWWWALFGLDERVGYAIGATAAGLVLSAICCFAVVDMRSRREDNE